MVNSLSDSRTPTPASDAHVVLLVNFVAPNLLHVCREIQSRVKRLTILSSVANESNRQWSIDWADLEVVVQKTWTITRHPQHPSGYREVNYVHVPLDTLGQLRRLRPDAIVSLELGARTLISLAYRKLNPSCVHVAAVNANQRSESGRGKLRSFVRRQILKHADWATHNGPSCREVLCDLGANPDRISPWHYAADLGKAYLGPLPETPSKQAKSLSLLTVGELSDRKGLMPAINQLSQWAAANPDQQLVWNLVGAGPLEQQLRQINLPSNLEVGFHGFCDADAIRLHYTSNDLMLFPTFCDEWGLVVDESLMSGLPVIGSCNAQSVTTLIRDGVNGHVYDPEVAPSLGEALDSLARLSSEDLHQMRVQARASVASRTAAASADQFAEAVSLALSGHRFAGKQNLPTVEPASRAPINESNLVDVVMDRSTSS
ncbi:MAG: glycosyltransferase family 4 protein [Rubripirellula sp.]